MYTSNYGSLAYRLTSYTSTGDTKSEGYNEDIVINNNPEDLFEIDILDGKERLSEIMKEQHIAEDFSNQM